MKTQFEQKKELGLIETPSVKTLEILEPIEGIILVGGYSALLKIK